MIKIFKSVVITFAAILLVFCFTSCDKVNTPEPGEKKLVKFSSLERFTADPSNGYTFVYDNNDRLVSATVKYDSTVIYNFIWESNVITVNKTSNTGSAPQSYKFVLENNLVQYSEKGNNERCTFKYNSANKFIESSDGNSAEWDGDKFMKFKENRIECILSYGTICNKGYLPFTATVIPPAECTVLYLAHPEIGGIRTNQLPSSMDLYLAGKKSSTMNFEYEFDQDGYVTKILSESASYVLVWE